MSESKAIGFIESDQVTRLQIPRGSSYALKHRAERWGELNGFEPYVGNGLVLPPVPGLADRLTVFDAGSVRISSTQLRADLEAGKSPAGSVPVGVAEYITKHGLYRSGVARR